MFFSNVPLVTKRRKRTKSGNENSIDFFFFFFWFSKSNVTVSSGCITSLLLKKWSCYLYSRVDKVVFGSCAVQAIIKIRTYSSVLKSSGTAEY